MKTKFKCVIVDDDQMNIEVLRDLCNDSGMIEMAYTFENPKEFLSVCKELDFDICLFDIIMPEIDGITLCKKVKDTPVILITGAENMLKSAINMVPPIDVILKPIRQDRFNRAIEKARKFIIDKAVEEVQFRLFYVAETKGQVKITASDILFVTTDETDHRNKRVFLKNGQIYTIMNCTLEQLRVFANSLIRVNKSELVASEAVHKIEYDLITLDGIKENNKEKQITLSRVYRKDFIEIYSSTI